MNPLNNEEDLDDEDLVGSGDLEKIIQKTLGLKPKKNRSEKSLVVSNRKRRPKLTEEMLIDPKIGLCELGKMFVGFKMDNIKGNEGANLNKIMQKFELWAQKLAPSFEFEDFVDKIEKLGNSPSVSQALDSLTEKKIKTKTTKSKSTTNKQQEQENSAPNHSEDMDVIV
eukprot:TRINITY_DN8446_c0_g1_i1.p1 TRINITY_DN8446_c0_g1~~TRINITY_DN8446_c0_g1_i1.p1  ORF type:complete len:180 (-),score=52.92 TRINITY_DN8446_c0_g1_i1:77-583(-)